MRPKSNGSNVFFLLTAFAGLLILSLTPVATAAPRVTPTPTPKPTATPTPTPFQKATPPPVTSPTPYSA